MVYNGSIIALKTLQTGHPCNQSYPPRTYSSFSLVASTVEFLSVMPWAIGLAITFLSFLFTHILLLSAVYAVELKEHPLNNN